MLRTLRRFDHYLGRGGAAGLSRDTAFLWGLQVFYRLSGVVVLMILSRTLAPEDIGLFFFALSISESLIVFASLSMDPVMVRRVARDPDQAGRHFAPLFAFRIYSSPAFLLGALIAAFFLARQSWMVILAVALAVLGESLYYSLYNLLIALKKVAQNAAIGMISQILFMGVFLAGMWIFPSLGAFLAANLIRSCSLLCITALVAHRYVRGWKPAWNRDFLKETAPFLFLTVIALLQEKVDTLLLGTLTDFQSVAHYSLALRVIIASYFVPQVLGVVIFPYLCIERDTRKIRSILLRGTFLLTGIAVAAMAVGFLYAGPITALLYGRLSAAVARLLLPMTILFPLRFPAIFLTSALQALRCEKRAMMAQAAATTTSVVLNVLLIPMFSIQGAIAANIASAGVQFLLVVIFSWRVISHAVPADAHPGSDPSRTP